MSLKGNYLDMPVEIIDLDHENQAFYKHCGSHQIHLQYCKDCDLMRYPPTTACPWCASDQAEWKPVEGKGTLHSYGEVHHAIQPVFKQFAPYLLLLVELDTQSGVPTEFEGIRFTGNLATADGELAPPEMVQQVGIGSRLRVVFKDIGDGMAVPLWTIDEDAEQPEKPWRYPIE